MGIVHGRPEIRSAGNSLEKARSRLGFGRMTDVLAPILAVELIRRPDEIRRIAWGRRKQLRRQNRSQNQKHNRQKNEPWAHSLGPKFWPIESRVGHGRPHHRHPGKIRLSSAPDTQCICPSQAPLCSCATVVAAGCKSKLQPSLARAPILSKPTPTVCFAPWHAALIS